ncbi:arginase [Microbacterium barkeri]|uniref:Arginase n=1 Tax=Microbacterium barkeri TaxID=33917 RepID=A0A9W6H0U9_9MICO|nr:arginase family protein [Microbacterium barkeri]MDR6875296.1 arginase [Microbacterium barkeri]GLJ60541.1 arginase [Microbacterium barkeri]
MARFLVVPQWQGSPSSRAMALIDGAEAIAGDLPRSACTGIDVPLEAGDTLGTGVLRASALQRVRDGIGAALDEHDDEPVIVVGGDCGVAVPAIGRVAADDLAVVWLDAHADLHEPSSSPSGAFSGMSLRGVLGGGEPTLALPRGAVTPDRVVLAGARILEDEEADFLETSAIRRVPAADFTPDALAEAATATGAARVYVHIDLDVLDPAHMSGVTAPTPFGLEPSQVVAAITALRSALPLAGASVAGFAPSSPAAAVDDMGTILRLIGALAR